MRADLKRLLRDSESKLSHASVGALPARPVGSIAARAPVARKIKWLVLSAVLIAVALVGYWLWPLGTPIVSSYLQLTHDGRLKSLGGTDGNRLYFTLRSPNSLAQLSIAGGEPAPLPLSLPRGGRYEIRDVSPDGSNLLLTSRTAGDSLWIAPLLRGSPRGLGQNVRSGSFSLDGSSILLRSFYGLISLARSDGTGLRKVADVGDDLNETGDTSLSPDGKVIRFTRNGVLFEVHADGTGLHPLLPNWQVRGMQLAGRWTLDGAFYFFVTTQTYGTGGQIWALDERRRLFRHPIPEPIPVATGPIRWDLPVPGRDGRTIFAVGETAHGELSRWDKGTDQFQPFLGGISADEVLFSPDGKSVAYVTYPDGDLWRANRDGSNPVQLTHPPIRPISVDWSPDGKQFVFYSRSDLRIYTIAADGDAPMLLMPQETGRDIDPVWSPDGKQVLFTTYFSDAHTEGRILDLANGQVSKLPEAEGKRPEGWSPDGRYIFAVNGPGGKEKGLELLDLRTKRWKMLVTGEENYPHISHDGRFIYFLHTVSNSEGENHMDVYRIPAMGGKTECIVDLKDFHLTGFWGFMMFLDPTDAPVVLRDISSDDIYALKLTMR
jgi:Tol biopolymer transport system component